MSIVSWVILGLIAGFLAKWIMPGKDDISMPVTIGLGIAGAFVGGFLGSLLGIGGDTDSFDFASVVTATIGAVVLLYAFRFFKNK